MLLLTKPDDERVKCIYQMWIHQMWTMSEEFQALGRLRPKLQIHRLNQAQQKLMMAINDVELALKDLQETGNDD